MNRECGRCGDLLFQHGRGKGACWASGCDCPSFVRAEEVGDDGAPAHLLARQEIAAAYKARILLDPREVR